MRDGVAWVSVSGEWMACRTVSSEECVVRVLARIRALSSVLTSSAKYIGMVGNGDLGVCFLEIDLSLD